MFTRTSSFLYTMSMRSLLLISFGPSREELLTSDSYSQNCLPYFSENNSSRSGWVIANHCCANFPWIVAPGSLYCITVHWDVSHNTNNPFVFITMCVLHLLFESSMSQLFVWRQAAPVPGRHMAWEALSQQTGLTETWCSVSSKKMSLETTAARQRQQQHEVGH